MPDNAIAIQIQTPDAMKSIGSMLNFAGQAQNLQRGNVALEQERALLKPNIAKGQAESERSKTALTHDQFRLQGDQSAAAMQIAGGLFKDPRIQAPDPNGAIEAISEARDQMIARGIPKPTAEWYAAQLTAKAHQPGAVYQSLQNMIQANAGAGTQAGVLNTPLTPLSTGGVVQPTQLQPGAPGAVQAGSQMPVTLSPGQRETVETDALGNKSVVSRSPEGSILTTRAMPSSNASQQTPPTFQLKPGDREAIPVLEAERTQSRNLLSSAPIAHTTNRGILEEIDKVISTGQTGGVMAKAASIAGAVGLKAPENAASAYDLIGKYTERNALEAAKAMGPGTNAGLEAAIKANGSAAYNPTALKKITKLNDAIVSGAEAYQPGLEKAIAADPQRGVLAKREFDQAWAQNFDPMVMQIHNAQKDGDKAEISDIVKSLGGKNSPKVKELIQKARNIEKLSTEGKL